MVMLKILESVFFNDIKVLKEEDGRFRSANSHPGVVQKLLWGAGKSQDTASAA